MAPKLYGIDMSPPVRAALMGAEVFEVTLEFVDMNLFGDDHLKPDYLKKNPLHTIPLFEDGDLILHDSHAILAYFADKYGKNDSWYPKDVTQRALVNQKLFMDTSILFIRVRDISFTAFREGEKPIPKKKLDAVIEAYGFMEEFLSRTKYIAGERMTIADLSAYTSVTALDAILEIDPKKYPKTVAWLQDMANQPFAKKCDAPGLTKLRTLFKDNLQYPEGF